MHDTSEEIFLNVFKTAVVLAALCFPATVMADLQIVDVGKVFDASKLIPTGVRADIGTTGYGGSLLWGVNPYVSLALGYHGGDLSWRGHSDLSINGDKYTVDSHNNNLYLNLELHPWGTHSNRYIKGLYLASGVAYLDQVNDLKRGIAANHTFQLNHAVFTAGENGVDIRGQMQYQDDFAPYIGLGIAPMVNREWGVFAEAGAYYTGKPTVHLSRVAGGTTTAVTDQALDQAIQQQASALADHSRYQWLPVAKVGFNYYW